MDMFMILCEALRDALDGTTDPWQIQGATGLPIERCTEIYELYKQLPMLIKNEKQVRELDKARIQRFEDFKKQIARDKLLKNELQPEYLI